MLTKQLALSKIPLSHVRLQLKKEFPATLLALLAKMAAKAWSLYCKDLGPGEESFAHYVGVVKQIQGRCDRGTENLKTLNELWPMLELSCGSSGKHNLWIGFAGYGDYASIFDKLEALSGEGIDRQRIACILSENTYAEVLSKARDEGVKEEDALELAKLAVLYKTLEMGRHQCAQLVHALSLAVARLDGNFFGSYKAMFSRIMTDKGASSKLDKSLDQKQSKVNATRLLFDALFQGFERNLALFQMPLREDGVMTMSGFMEACRDWFQGLPETLALRDTQDILLEETTQEMLKKMVSFLSAEYALPPLDDGQLRRYSALITIMFLHDDQAELWLEQRFSSSEEGDRCVRDGSDVSDSESDISEYDDFKRIVSGFVSNPIERGALVLYILEYSLSAHKRSYREKFTQVFDILFEHWKSGITTDQKQAVASLLIAEIKGLKLNFFSQQTLEYKLKRITELNEVLIEEQLGGVRDHLIQKIFPSIDSFQWCFDWSILTPLLAPAVMDSFFKDKTDFERLPTARTALYAFCSREGYYEPDAFFEDQIEAGIDAFIKSENFQEARENRQRYIDSFNRCLTEEHFRKIDAKNSGYNSQIRHQMSYIQKYRRDSPV